MHIPPHESGDSQLSTTSVAEIEAIYIGHDGDPHLNALEAANQCSRDILAEISRLASSNRRSKIISRIQALREPWMDSLDNLFQVYALDHNDDRSLELIKAYVLWQQNERMKAYQSVEAGCRMMPYVTPAQFDRELAEYQVGSIATPQQRWQLATVIGLQLDNEQAHLADAHRMGPLSKADKVRTVATSIGIAATALAATIVATRRKR